MAKIYSNKTITKTRALASNEIVASFRYRGFSSRLPKNNFKLYDYELVKQDIINHFYIRKGEKLENPKFGCIIWDMLFENFTAEVKEAIAKNVEEIINFDKRVAVNRVTINTTDQGMRIEAELLYLPTNLVDVLTVEFDRRNNVI